MMFLQESLTIAAYEAARVGSEKGGTNSLATTRGEEVLSERGVRFVEGAAVFFGNPDFDTADTLEHVTVTVAVPCNDNNALSGWFFADRTLSASVTMRKQFNNN